MLIDLFFFCFLTIIYMYAFTVTFKEYGTFENVFT